MMYQCWEVVTISASRKRKVKFALSQFLCKESNKKGKKNEGGKNACQYTIEAAVPRKVQLL